MSGPFTLPILYGQAPLYDETRRVVALTFAVYANTVTPTVVLIFAFLRGVDAQWQWAIFHAGCVDGLTYWCNASQRHQPLGPLLRDARACARAAIYTILTCRSERIALYGESSVFHLIDQAVPVWRSGAPFPSTPFTSARPTSAQSALLDAILHRGELVAHGRGYAGAATDDALLSPLFDLSDDDGLWETVVDLDYSAPQPPGEVTSLPFPPELAQVDRTPVPSASQSLAVTPAPAAVRVVAPVQLGSGDTVPGWDDILATQWATHFPLTHRSAGGCSIGPHCQCPQDLDPSEAVAFTCHYGHTVCIPCLCAMLQAYTTTCHAAKARGVEVRAVCCPAPRCTQQLSHYYLFNHIDKNPRMTQWRVPSLIAALGRVHTNT